MCRRAWPGSSVPGRVSLACGTARAEVLALPFPVPHCPGCNISCMAIPGCKIVICEYLPFPCECSGTGQPVEQSLALPTPWEALAHSGHSLHALLKAQNQGFCDSWRPAGTMSAPSSSLWDHCRQGTAPSSSLWDHCRQGNWDC